MISDTLPAQRWKLVNLIALVRPLHVLGMTFGFIMRNWLMQLWRLRSTTTCPLQAGNTLGGVIQLESGGPRTRVASSVNPSPRVRKTHVPTKAGRQEGGEGVNSSVLHLSFYSDPQQIGGHPHWGGLSTFWSPSVQMLIASGNTLTDTPRNNI